MDLPLDFRLEASMHGGYRTGRLRPAAPARPVGGAFGSGSAAIPAAPKPTEAIMPKLTDLQRVLLSAAAKRDDGALLPLPKRVTLDPAARTRAFKALLKKQLVRRANRPAGCAGLARGEGRAAPQLVVTPAGLEAIGVVPEETGNGPGKNKTRKAAPKRAPKQKKQRTPPETVSTPARASTKLALVIELLRRDGGATIAEIVAATGWQQHSVRGAISGTLKKKLELAVSSEREEAAGASTASRRRDERARSPTPHAPGDDARGKATAARADGQAAPFDCTRYRQRHRRARADAAARAGRALAVAADGAPPKGAGRRLLVGAIAHALQLRQVGRKRSSVLRRLER